MQNNTYTVGQVNRYIAGMFTDDLLLKRISVKGEVGTCTYTSQGHVYFSLKDNDSQISAVIWRSRTISGLKFKLETGMKVVVTGNVEVYERDGRYQIIATEIVKEACNVLGIELLDHIIVSQTGWLSLKELDFI